MSGPNGVIIVPKTANTFEVWAGDGPLLSPACPIDSNAGVPNQFAATISGGTLTVTSGPAYGTITVGQLLIGAGTIPGVIGTITGGTFPNFTISNPTYSALVSNFTGFIDDGSGSGTPSGVAGTVLTVTTPPSHPILVGDRVTGTGIPTTPFFTFITAQGTGTGGIGTYTVSVRQLVNPAEAMTATPYFSAITVVRPSQVVVFSVNKGTKPWTASWKKSILVGNPTLRGAFRADELCYSPADNVVFIANDNPFDNFGTFIDTNTYTPIQTMRFDGSDSSANNITAIGLEQCEFDPRNNHIYFNIPDSTPAGGPSPGGGHTVRFSRRSSSAPHFSVDMDFNTDDIIACAPAGLAVGPNHQLGLGCGGTNGLVISDVDGSTIATLPGLGGADEAWYNAGSNHYYFAVSGAAHLGVADAGNASTSSSGIEPTADDTCIGGTANGNVQDPACTASGGKPSGFIPTSSGDHSVAADSFRNLVFVPIRMLTSGIGTGVCNASTDPFGQPGLDGNGCIAVYQSPGDGDNGEPIIGASGVGTPAVAGGAAAAGSSIPGRP
jgi:hypothetical protein